MMHLKVLPYLLGMATLFVALSLSPGVAMADVTSITDVIDKDVTDNATPPHVIGHISSNVRTVRKLISVSFIPNYTSAQNPTSNFPRLGDQSVMSTDSCVAIDSAVEVRTQNVDFDEDLASRFTSLTGPGDKKSWLKFASKGTTTCNQASNTIHCGQCCELWKSEETRTETETETSANKKLGIRTSTTRMVVFGLVVRPLEYRILARK